MRIDAHQHFWTTTRTDYGWLTPDLTDLYRDFLPADLNPILNAARIDGTILVQAAPSVAETEFLLELADQHPFIKAVVGWVDFAAPKVADDIARLCDNPKLAGLRPMIQDLPDVDWVQRDGLTPAFDALIAHDLTFDALTLPQHLPYLHQRLLRHPEMRVVIDHGSKPLIHVGAIREWAASMTALGNDTGAYCKLSGLVTEAGPDWTLDDLRPYVDHLLDVFGPDRLIWGSDWPVCTLASSYERWIGATNSLLSALTGDERKAVFGGNAISAYNLESQT